jgi:hypothetical protein
VRIAYRHRILVTIIILFSIVVGQYLSRPSARVYHAEGTAILNGPDAQSVRQVFRQLENAVSTNELISLSTKLGIDDSIAENILKLESFYLIDYMSDSVADKVDYSDSHSLTDTVNKRMKDRIYIRMKTKNIEQVPVVENAILNYLNNNKMLKSQFDSKKAQYAAEIEICNSELERLDSLADISYFKKDITQLSLTNNQVLLGEQRKQLFYGDMLRIQEIKAISQFKIADMNAPVEIPASLVVVSKPINSRLKYGVYSILIGFISAVVLASLLEGMKKIIKFLNSK